MEGVVMLDPVFWHQKRVLLTGHTGFKGSWLLLWLRELGAQITGYSLAAEPQPNLFRQLAPEIEGSFSHIEADLADLAALQAHARAEAGEKWDRQAV